MSELTGKDQKSLSGVNLIYFFFVVLIDNTESPFSRKNIMKKILFPYERTKEMSGIASFISCLIQTEIYKVQIWKKMKKRACTSHIDSLHCDILIILSHV